MAFEILMTQTVRMCCDRCGAKAGEYVATVEEAIESGKTLGFVDAGLEINGCRRQAWLCPACHADKPAFV